MIRFRTNWRGQQVLQVCVQVPTMMRGQFRDWWRDARQDESTAVICALSRLESDKHVSRCKPAKLSRGEI